MSSQWQLLRAMVVSVLLVVPAAAQEGIHWQPDIDGAQKLAAQSGRLVLVHFWTPECGPCRMLEQNVFNQPGVAGALETRFVPVKLNANENSATAQKLGITRVPTDIILTPEGQVVGKLISPPTPSAYVAEVSQVATQYSTRSGGTFDNAVAGAPLPSHINSAYANLQIPAATQPAIPIVQQSPSADGRAAVDRFVSGVPTANNGSRDSVAILNPATPAGPTISAPPMSVSTASQTASNVAAPVGPTGGLAGVPGSQKNGNQTGRYVALSPSPQPTPTPDRYGAPSAQQPDAGFASSVTPIAPAPSNSPVTVDNRYAVPMPTTATSQPPAPIRNEFASAPAMSNIPLTPTPAPAAAVPPTAVAGIENGLAQAPSAAAMPPAMIAANSNSAIPDARRLPPNAPPLGFEGYCPVTMRTTWKWVPGNPQFGAIHRGRTYWFVGQQEQQLFLKNPDYYSPALSGIDPVLAIDHHQVVPGRREHSLDYDNLFYLFASEATLQQFTANPERYASGVRQAMGVQRGRLVR